MRIRLAELMKVRKLTAYALAQESEGRISTSALYRLLKNDGHARYLDSDLLEALCDVLRVGPGGLLERDTPPSRKTPARRDARRVRDDPSSPVSHSRADARGREAAPQPASAGEDAPQRAAEPPRRRRGGS